MPDEREPLLRTVPAPTYAAVASCSSPPSGQATTHLKPRAEALLTELRATSEDASIPGQLARDVDPYAELAVLLYAIHLLQAPEKVPSIRRALANATVNQRLFEIIADEVETLLDMGGTRQDDEDGEDIERIFWTGCPIDSTEGGLEEEQGEGLSVIDLLLPPYIRGSSPFWSHPLLHHVLLYTWSEGTRSASELDKSKDNAPVLRRLEQSITPRRLHFLDLISFLVLLCLTVAVAMRPAYFTPYDAPTRISGVEIAWIVMSASHLLSVLQPGGTAMRRLFHLPTCGALLCSPFAPDASYTLLTWSIVPLTSLLVLPYAPSLAFIAPGSASLPLSAMLVQLLQRGSTAGGLLLPLMLITFGVFAWAMNGDIFRAFFSKPTTGAMPALVNAASESIEVGIAPFEARLSLFVTFTLLLLLALILTIARAIQPPTHLDSQTMRWRGGTRPGDKWDLEYGIGIARSARERLAMALRNYRIVDGSTACSKNLIRDATTNGELENGHTDTRPQWKSRNSLRVMIPLNAVVLPLDLARRISNILPQARPIAARIDDLRGSIAILVVGTLCTCLRALGI